MRTVLFAALALLVGACTPQTTPETGPKYESLVGRWQAMQDTSCILNLRRICCGSKPGLEGTLRWGSQQADLRPPSYANAYLISGTGADSTPGFAFELILSTAGEGICSGEGYVQDTRGRQAFPQPALPDSARLALSVAAKTATGCDSPPQPMVFIRKP